MASSVPPRYDVGMARKPNFADPDFEPTDAELAELVHEAFADVADRNREALARLHQQVMQLRAAALAKLPPPAESKGGR